MVDTILPRSDHALSDPAYPVKNRRCLKKKGKGIGWVLYVAKAKMAKDEGNLAFRQCFFELETAFHHFSPFLKWVKSIFCKKKIFFFITLFFSFF